MRTYGQKFLKSAATRASKAATESRDAILWDVLTADRAVRCKIQGSNEYVVARFPQNWDTIPSWCKKGQAVRLVHRGGNRGYIEVQGYGRAIPTPLSGGGTPTTDTPPNAILTGCIIRAIPQTPRMNVWVEVGTVRFGGATKTVPPVSIANGGAIIRADMGLQFGQVAGIFAITAPNTGNFRYDAISVGADLVVDITTGAQFTATESKPTIPTGNILIGYIFLRGGMTSITANDLPIIYTPPVASKLVLSVVDNGATQTATVAVKDQWGASIATTGGWTLAATIDSGGGSLDSASKNTGAGSSVDFVYTEGTAGELVMIHVSLAQGDVALDGYTAIQL